MSSPVSNSIIVASSSYQTYNLPAEHSTFYFQNNKFTVMTFYVQKEKKYVTAVRIKNARFEEVEKFSTLEDAEKGQKRWEQKIFEETKNIQ